ncbi:hypothetical protein QJQ45_014514 [Haematococcus lacustris]|nr:hypothetical protein QJQ45_014514 [Haematococcus lacustris]
MPIVVSGSRVTLVSSPGVEYAVTVRSIDNVSFLAFPRQRVSSSGSPMRSIAIMLMRAACYAWCTQVVLKVDGKAIGGPGCKPNQLTNFKFAAAQTLTATSAEDVSNIQDLKHGKLQLELWQSEEAPRKARPAAAVLVNSGFSAGTGAQLARLPEGKKFFMAPSLSTSGGSRGKVMNLVQGCKLVRLLADLTIDTETCATLVLRKVLDPRLPDHAAVLAAWGPGGTALPLPPPQPAPVAPVLPLATRQVQQGVGQGETTPRQQVKRERQAGGSGAGASAPPALRTAQCPVVDLTEGEELRVVVRGRVMRRDEFAVCDLTQRDSTPTWQIKKKPRLVRRWSVGGGGEGRRRGGEGEGGPGQGGGWVYIVVSRQGLGLFGAGTLSWEHEVRVALLHKQVAEAVRAYRMSMSGDCTTLVDLGPGFNDS